jgi:hypothetical protein
VFDRYGEWVADNSDVQTSADYNDIGVEPADLDTSTMVSSPEALTKDG